MGALTTAMVTVVWLKLVRSEDCQDSFDMKIVAVPLVTFLCLV